MDQEDSQPKEISLKKLVQIWNDQNNDELTRQRRVRGCFSSFGKIFS